MKRLRNIFQIKVQELRVRCNRTEINNLPDKQLKGMAIKMLTELRRMVDYSENYCNKERECITKY